MRNNRRTHSFCVRGQRCVRNVRPRSAFPVDRPTSGRIERLFHAFIHWEDCRARWGDLHSKSSDEQLPGGCYSGGRDEPCDPLARSSPSLIVSLNLRLKTPLGPGTRVERRRIRLLQACIPCVHSLIDRYMGGADRAVEVGVSSRQARLRTDRKPRLQQEGVHLIRA